MIEPGEYAPGTVALYERLARRYEAWCAVVRRAPYPALEDVVVSWILHEWPRPALGTVQPAMGAIRWACRLRGLPAPLLHPRLCGNLGKSQSAPPIRSGELLRLLASDARSLRERVLVLLARHLSVSEIAALRWVDVTLSASAVVLQLPTATVTVPAHPVPALCLVRALTEWRRGPARWVVRGPHGATSKVHVRQVLRACGVSPRRLRAGAALEALELGLSQRLVEQRFRIGRGALMNAVRG